MSMRRLRQNPEKVALLAEGVDRNVVSRFLPMQYTGVALLAEGVDRNVAHD